MGVDALLRRDGQGHAYATLDYLHHLAGGDGWELAAFARGYGGARNEGFGWRPELGLIGGVGLTW